MRHVYTLVLCASTAFAAPPNSPYRDGANHHKGDDSFVAKLGRTPDARDSEKLRMKLHFEQVRAWLASRPATKPELETKRHEILRHLDDYIAKGTTPVNDKLPWRTPVFIDEHQTICAVGYLIEQTAGRALPDKIAATHRYDFIEDITAAMPEVQQWVAESGFTLEELGNIQPGYIEPNSVTWQRWDVASIPNGAYEKLHGSEESGITTRGKFVKHRMQGAWTTTDEAGHVVGSGELARGNGTWTSFYPDGKKLAEGRYADNDPQGTWTFYHPSGNIAAIGAFRGGTRDGKWQFFYDTSAKTPIAIGRFGGGAVAGTWRHFDAAGALIAKSHEETPTAWRKWDVNSGAGELLEVVPGADGIQHTIHVGTNSQEKYQLDSFALGKERVYVQSWRGDSERVLDTDGNQLVRISGAWEASDCHWGGKRKTIARTGDIARLHALLYNDVHRGYYDAELPECGPARALDADRGKRIDALLASREKVRAASPQFVTAMVLGQSGNEELKDADKDLVRLIQEHMSFYVEWPHIDGLFHAVLPTLPGHVVRNWYDTMDGQKRAID